MLQKLVSGPVVFRLRTPPWLVGFSARRQWGPLPWVRLRTKFTVAQKPAVLCDQAPFTGRRWYAMKLISEYLERSLHFERMAAEPENAGIREQLLKQAAEYLKLAEKKAALVT